MTRGKVSVLNTEGISGEKWTKVAKTPFMKNDPFVRSKPSIANAMKPGGEHCAKGGYHAALSNARIS